MKSKLHFDYMESVLEEEIVLRVCEMVDNTKVTRVRINNHFK